MCYIGGGTSSWKMRGPSFPARGLGITPGITITAGEDMKTPGRVHMGIEQHRTAAKMITDKGGENLGEGERVTGGVGSTVSEGVGGRSMSHHSARRSRCGTGMSHQGGGMSHLDVSVIEGTMTGVGGTVGGERRKSVRLRMASTGVSTSTNMSTSTDATNDA